jgi:pimeloyl-ACP methyl ester carboxylesterase
VAATALGTNVGLDDLGVTSLLNLRLSQRLRRFIGREFSPFVLSRNPTVASLAAALSGPAAAAAAAANSPQVLCLHGYRTSSTVLRQQMLPLARILLDLGYALVVPDGPYKVRY